MVICYVTMPLQTGYVELNIDHQNSYTQRQLFSIRRNKYTSTLDKNTYLKIKELGIKRNCRGSREGRFRPRIQDQNKDINEKWLKSLSKSNIIYRKGKDTRFFLTNVQCIINKLDMIVHHMEVDKIDIGFITETWIKNTIDRDLMASQAKNAGYKIISHGHMNRKGGGLMYI